MSVSCTAQQRPGPKPRQHKWGLSLPSPSTTPLNKGRDRSPGNTPSRSARSSQRTAAQQRPGPKPRQHSMTMRRLANSCVAAQQRPGPKPRQHWNTVAMGGTETFAQQRPGPKPRQHRSAPARSRARARTLNKGRDRSPGNTLTTCGSPAWHASRAQQRPGPKPRQHAATLGADLRRKPRSTKAGTEAPATPADAAEQIDDLHRSTKAGTEAPATRSCGNVPPFPTPALNKGRDRSPGNTGRRTARRSRCALRSTKAGTEAPATPRRAGRSGCAESTSLNKGRDRSPGNTRGIVRSTPPS